MSLFVRPVLPSDLTQLQLGIEFFTDSNEANTEASLITDPPASPTVYTYAASLLAKNISLSQVAMAVDSLMFGTTDNTTELTKLATQFLPAQVAAAVGAGLNPTVYAAEALGLALAGGNGTSNAFAGNFSSLSASDFASAVSNLIGVNSVAIQGFAHNWVSFYTANPSATFGLPVTLAAYGAAFGDAVGAALLNPTVNGALALLTSEVQNALIDNAEGSYKAGVPLLMEPAHLALQGEAFPIPNAGGAPLSNVIDWATLAGTPAPYAEFVAPAQSSQVEIDNAPNTFTLNTQHYATSEIDIFAAGDGNLLTIILGDSTAGDNPGPIKVDGYSTTDIIVVKSPGADITQIAFCPDLVISGNGSVSLFCDAVVADTITVTGVSLTLYYTDATGIDASNAPVLIMNNADDNFGNVGTGVTVLGGAGPGNILHGSVGLDGLDISQFPVVTFSDGSVGVSVRGAQADNITGGSSGGDTIFGDGGADTITLPNHSQADTVVFGLDKEVNLKVGPAEIVLAITDGKDMAYPGSWGVITTPTAIPSLFPGSIGGISADMTVITGFGAGSSGDELQFTAAAWNASSAGFAFPKGNLVTLNGALMVQPSDGQLSAVWVNSASNSSLKTSDDVLRYAPFDASVKNAQQLAAQLHTSSDAVVLAGSGFIAPGQDKHILVAYDASSNVNGTIQHAVNIADVDLVNTSATNQTSTANLNVYASDMVHLTGVSLTSLTSANIDFI